MLAFDPIASNVSSNSREKCKMSCKIADGFKMALQENLGILYKSKILHPRRDQDESKENFDRYVGPTTYL